MRSLLRACVKQAPLLWAKPTNPICKFDGIPSAIYMVRLATHATSKKALVALLGVMRQRWRRVWLRWVLVPTTVVQFAYQQCFASFMVCGHRQGGFRRLLRCHHSTARLRSI